MLVFWSSAKDQGSNLGNGKSFIFKMNFLTGNARNGE